MFEFKNLGLYCFHLLGTVHSAHRKAVHCIRPARIQISTLPLDNNSVSLALVQGWQFTCVHDMRYAVSEEAPIAVIVPVSRHQR